MADDPWALFADDDAESAQRDASAAGDGEPAASVTTAVAALSVEDTPSSGRVAKEDTTTGKSTAAAAAAAAAERPLVSVPFQHTLPVLARFIRDHAEATVADAGRLAKSATNAAEREALQTLHEHLRALEQLVSQLAPKSKGKAGRGAPKSAPPAAEATILDALHAEAMILDTCTWSWMKAHGSWPHVVFRECYVMAKLARAVQEAHRGLVDSAMECVDLSLIMGVPGSELEEMIDAIEMGCIASSAARAAVTEVETGVAKLPLPTIPPVLAPCATLQLPAIDATKSVPRALGQGSRSKRDRKRSRKRKGKKSVAAAAGADASSDEGSDVEEDERLVAVRAVPAGAEKQLTLADFRKNYQKPSKSVVICNATSHWDALARWRDLEYLVEAYGHRTVPVEIGQHLSGFWQERPMKFRDFVAEYIAPSLEWGWGKNFTVSMTEAVPGSSAPAVHPNRIGYLAQHMLFHQIPRMTQEFDIPVYAGDDVGSVNSWFGTAGTVTRLHHDSYENLLTQVLGYKYVRLYAPSETPKLYPIQPSTEDATTSQGNISAYDVERPDYDAHPLARDAVYTETILGPGDMLYIPTGHWHFVKGLTPSFSINFWF